MLLTSTITLWTEFLVGTGTVNFSFPKSMVNWASRKVSIRPGTFTAGSLCKAPLQSQICVRSATLSLLTTMRWLAWLLSYHCKENLAIVLVVPGARPVP